MPSSVKKRSRIETEDKDPLQKGASNDGKETTECKDDDGVGEIDKLFAETKKKKTSPPAAAAANTKPKLKQQKQQRQQHKQPRPITNSDWVDDGLGGKYNAEGYTGRVEDGIKIFKAHVIQKPNAGNTKDCPFDCDCCYI